MEAEGDEGEYNSGDPRRAVGAGERARQTERAVAAEGEAEKRRDAADRERTKSRGEQGEEQQRDSVVVLAEGERVLVRVEDVRVEEMERIVEGLVVVPPESPGDHIGVAAVSYSVAQMQNPRPRHQGS